MDFLNKISNTISSTTKEVAKKTKEITDTAKIMAKINGEKENIQKKYKSIGETYYKKYADTNIEDEELRMLCNSINVSSSKIESYQKELQEVKGTIKCSQCNKDIPNNAVFCNYCGNKAEQKNDDEVKATESVDGEKCSKCNTQYTDEDVFCQTCGNKLKG